VLASCALPPLLKPGCLMQKQVTLLLQCFHNVVTLLSHCCYTVVTLLLHCCYTVVTLLGGRHAQAILQPREAAP
jgi:hypothetical protein